MRPIQTLLFSTCLFLLAACSDAKKVEPLAGERLNILASVQELQPSPAAALTQMVLPRPIDFQDWPQAYGVPTHAPKHAALPKKVYRAWTRRIGHIRGHVANPPIVLGQQLFAVNSDHEVSALNVKTGEVLWKKEMKLPKGEETDFTAGLAATEDALFVTTAIGQVFALNPITAEELWTVELGAPLRAAPAVRDGRLYVVSHDNRMFVLNVADGTLLWTHAGISENLALASGATPAVTKDTAIVAYTSGDVYALNAADGKFKWQAALNRLATGRKNTALQGIAAAPVVAAKAVFGVTVNGVLAAFDLETGQRLWRQSIATSQTPWVAGNAIFVLTDDGRLVGVNAVDGAIRWITRLNDYIREKEENTARYWSGPVLAGNRLMVASSDGYAMSVNPETGAKLMAVQLLKRTGVSVPPIVAQQGLFFLTDDGNVVAFKE